MRNTLGSLVLGVLTMSVAFAGCPRGAAARIGAPPEYTPRGRAAAPCGLARRDEGGDQAAPSLWLVALVASAGCTRTGTDGAPDIGSRQLAAAGQAQCRVVKDPDKPLIVEWSGMDAAELEARMLRGVVAVRYEHCEMEILRGCRIADRYTYSESATRMDRLHLRSTDDLLFELPLGAAALSAHTDRGESLDLEIVVVGRYDAPGTSYPRAALAGSDCARATHVVSGVSLGAFRLSANESRSRRGGSSGGLVQIGGGRSHSARVLRESPPNHLEFCMSVDESTEQRRAVCRAPIRLEVMPVQQPGAADQALLVPPRAEPPTGVMDTTGSVEAHQLYDVAIALQNDPAVPPEHRTAAWCSLAGIEEANPYLTQADALCRQWNAYTDSLRTSETRLRADYEVLREMFALANIPALTRGQAVRTFLATHARLSEDDYREIRAVKRAARRLADGKRATLPDLSSREPRPARIRSRVRDVGSIGR